MTQKDFCEKCGISFVTLKRILNGENISLKTMNAVTEVTGIPLTETPQKLHMIYTLMKEIVKWMASPNFDLATTPHELRVLLTNHRQIILRDIPALSDIIYGS